VKPVVAQPVEVEPELVLNGAQIQAALEIVKEVVRGQIPRDAALGLLKTGFNMSEKKAQELLGSAGAGFVPAPEESSP
jgi:hypothetical protein